MTARAEANESRTAFVIQNGLSHDGPGRVAGTKKQNVKMLFHAAPLSVCALMRIDAYSIEMAYYP